MLAHVAAAVLLLEDYPATAQQYAAVAKRMAGRNAAVRETLGMCAYQAGDFETALREFKAAGRISGRDDLVPLIADCERALGRPERALEIASAPVTLNQADRVGCAWWLPVPGWTWVSRSRGADAAGTAAGQ